jgi:DNA-binding response OmpR family regulator
MADATILIVEDDPTLLLALKDNFEYAGYRVVTAAGGEEGQNQALAVRPDLIVLDIMLPGLNGYEVCRAIREQQLDMLIIMLTAKSQESDIVLGLNLGADDYVTKPFSIKELLARANAFLRKHRHPPSELRRFGEFELHTVSCRLLHNGREIPLTPKEYALLEYLTKQEGRALTREHLLNHVWGYDVVVTGRSVDRCVNTLRAKIEPDPRHPRYLHTVRDVGYRFDPDP